MILYLFLDDLWINESWILNLESFIFVWIPQMVRRRRGPMLFYKLTVMGMFLSLIENKIASALSYVLSQLRDHWLIDHCEIWL